MQMVHHVIVELTNHSLQNHITWILQRMIGQLKIHEVNYLHNLETITMGVITVTMNSTVNKYNQQSFFQRKA